MATGPPVIIVAPTIVRYAFQHTLGSGVKVDNIWDISIDATGPHDRDSVVDDFNSHVCSYWQNGALQCYGTATTFNGAAWIDLNTPTGRTGHLGPSGGEPTHGATPSPYCPPNVSHLVHKNTTSSRGARGGRNFMPEVPEGQVDDRGNLTSGRRGEVESHVGAFNGAVTDYNLTGGLTNPAHTRVVHVHKPDKADPTTWTWSSTDVSSITCDPMVATNRRRLR